jgi:Tfp pilus assembly protein PilF
MSVRKDYDRAEEFYKRAIEADPKDAASLTGYGLFMSCVRGDYDRADESYRRAVKADPHDASSLAGYAFFLHTARKDCDQADELYRRAIEADPSYANGLVFYAFFLKSIRGDCDWANQFYKRATEANPDLATFLDNAALFLDSVHRDRDLVDEFYRFVLDANPKSPESLANYAGFLLARGRPAEGFLKLGNALQAEPSKALQLECWFYQYAHLPDVGRRETALDQMKTLLLRGIRLPGRDLSRNVERAIVDGHPLPIFLRKLAQVIADEAKIDELSGFPECSNPTED